jgi:hypothetical protein
MSGWMEKKNPGKVVIWLSLSQAHSEVNEPRRQLNNAGEMSISPGR